MELTKVNQCSFYNSLSFTLSIILSLILEFDLEEKVFFQKILSLLVPRMAAERFDMMARF